MNLLLYRLKNFSYRLRGIKQELMTFFGIGNVSSLSVRVIHPDNTITDYGIVCRQVITDAGVAYLAAAFTGTGEPENFNYHDCGTGTTAADVTDTGLETPYGGARSSGTQSNPSANVYRTVATISFSGSFAITEHGIFSASSSGTCWDRHVFSAINVGSGDAIEFTYNLTIDAGG